MSFPTCPSCGHLAVPCLSESCPHAAVAPLAGGPLYCPNCNNGGWGHFSAGDAPPVGHPPWPYYGDSP